MAERTAGPCYRSRSRNSVKSSKGPVEVILLLFCLLSLASAVAARGKVDESKMEYIGNGTIRLGVNLGQGGAITYIADSQTGTNIINNWDWGRQVQMSFFSGPVPYAEKGRKPKKHWEHIGWNRIQAGDQRITVEVPALNALSMEL